MAEVLNLGLGTGATASELVRLGFGIGAAAIVGTPGTNLDGQVAADLAATFFRLEDVPTQRETDLCDSFFRLNMGWATNAILGASGDTSIPLTAGTAVVGIFDDGTVEGGDRGGPRWYCKASDGYVTGLYLTVTGQGTYQLDSISPEGDGLVFECLLSLRTT